MIKRVKVLIPEATIKIDYLWKMAEEWNKYDATEEDDKLQIQLLTYVSDNPSICFDDRGKKSESYHAGKLEIGFNGIRQQKRTKWENKPKAIVLKDKTGDYLLVKWPLAEFYQMDLEQLYHRLKGHIKSLDHMGVNINPEIMLSEKYSQLITELGSSSRLIAYPWNAKWFFIMSPVGCSGPLFEIVGDFKYRYPEIQIDTQTDLSPRQVIEMFPKPYGYYDPDPKTGDYCVSVFIYTGWKDTSLRVDIRFRVDKPNWREWLVREGKRVA